MNAESPLPEEVVNLVPEISCEEAAGLQSNIQQGGIQPGDLLSVLLLEGHHQAARDIHQPECPDTEPFFGLRQVTPAVINPTVDPQDES